MPKLYQYQNFDLAIQGADNTYSARVLDSPGGQTSKPVTFGLPFQPSEIETLLKQLGQPRARIRGRDNAREDAARRLGGGLYKTIFQDDVQKCWQSSLIITASQKNGLRLRLRLNGAPALAHLPWELLYDSTLDQFFNHSAETPLVRYLDLPVPTHPLKLEPPLKILVLISLPDDVPGLDAEQEWENLNDAVQELRTRNLVKLERTQHATLSALLRQLRRDEYHVLHFIGHGAFDEEAEESVLLLEGEQEQAKEIDGQKFATVLHDHRSLRLVLLNACEGARSGAKDPFSGVAQKLIQQGIPAVVAMQFAITDEAAITFSHSFYESLADNYPIDAAVSEARKAIYAEEDETTEWATPVLYMRAPDGVIFDVTREVGTSSATGPILPSSNQSPASSVLTTTNPQPIPPSGQPLPLTQAFNPLGKWNIQVQDMVGSRLLVEFGSNGTFQMIQQVGMFQVPVNGSWNFNPFTKQLSLQGVVNTFQPFILAITISGALPNGYAAVGSDGIGYVLTRA